MKTVITYKKTATILPKPRNYTHLALKATRRCVKALQALCTLCLPWKTQQINGHVCFTNNYKTQKHPAEAKLGMCRLWCLCSEL